MLPLPLYDMVSGLDTRLTPVCRPENRNEIIFKEKMNCGEEKVLKCPQITIREFKMSTVFVKEFVINKNLARKYDALKGLSGTNWDELDITEDIEN